MCINAKKEKNCYDISYSKDVAMKVSIISVVVNMILSLIKFIIGIFGHSQALISDAVHSASDVFSTFIVMIGVNISAKAEDREHPYGHERLECIASMILSLILAVTGVVIGREGVLSFISIVIKGTSAEIVIPSKIALFAALLSIVVKEAMYWYTRYYAKKINSDILMADAWHHRTDAFSSVGSFIGIIFSLMGFAFMDPLASIVICIFILGAAFSIMKDSLCKITDHSCDAKLEGEIMHKITEQDGVISVKLLKTRQFGSRIYADLIITADPDISLVESDAIAENVHDVIEKDFPQIKHIMIHVDPDEN